MKETKVRRGCVVRSLLVMYIISGLLLVLLALIVSRVEKEDAGKGVTKEKDYRDVDGLITNVPGLILGTFYADCVPLLFVDPVHHAIGCSHSGWRGDSR